MTRRPPNFIWRKIAGRPWLAANELALQEQTRAGDYAVIETPAKTRVQIEAFCATRVRAHELQAAFGGSVRALPYDWQARFLAAARTKPLRIGGRLTIAGDAADLEGGPTLLIPAAAAFGTGGHATTAMSLRLLERFSRPLAPGWRMLDAGTGSGILALAAAHFGAGWVLAIDNDPKAVSTARENAARNHIATVKFVVADVQRTTKGTFDIIAANLYSELLIAVLPRFRRSLAPGGHLILSGVLRQQEPTLTRALRSRGFRILETRRRGKWIALLASSSPTPAPARARNHARPPRSGARSRARAGEKPS